MSGFDSAGVLSALAAMLGGLDGMQQVYIGAPESLSKRVSAYVAVGGNTQPISDRITGVLSDERAWFVGFGYRVADAERDAELALAAFVDAFARAFYANRTLGGLIQSNPRLDFSLTRDPRYEVRAGQEFRVLPVLVIGTQRETYDTVNQ
jgi:hypothetical protein